MVEIAERHQVTTATRTLPGRSRSFDVVDSAVVDEFEHQFRTMWRGPTGVRG